MRRPAGPFKVGQRYRKLKGGSWIGCWTTQFPSSGTDDAGATPRPSRGFQRVLQRAAMHVESSGKTELKGYNVLVAIFSEPDSFAVQAWRTAASRASTW